MPVLTPQTKSDTPKLVFHSTYQGLCQHTCETSHWPLPSLIPVRAVMPEKVGIGCAALYSPLKVQPSARTCQATNYVEGRKATVGGREGGVGGDAEMNPQGCWLWESLILLSIRNHILLRKPEQRQWWTKTGNLLLFHVMKSGGRSPGLIRRCHKVKKDSGIFFSSTSIILASCMLSCFSHFWFFVTLWTTSCQAPLSMGFSRQEYWTGLPFLSPGDLPDPGVKLWSPALLMDSLSSEPPGTPLLALAHGLDPEIMNPRW